MAEPRRPADDHGVWVYGVVPGDAPELPRRAGVDERHDVELIRHAGLAAVGSAVPREQYRREALEEQLEDLQRVAALARAHQRVLDDALAVGPVVPLRICTIYDSAARVREMLEHERPALAYALRRLSGTAEWGVKAYAAGTAPAETAAPSRPASGIDYLARKREQRDAASAARRAADAVVELIHERLSEHALGAVVSPAQDPRLSGEEREMLLNAAYLVPATSPARGRPTTSRRCHERAPARRGRARRRPDRPSRPPPGRRRRPGRRHHAVGRRRRPRPRRAARDHHVGGDGAGGGTGAGSRPRAAGVIWVYAIGEGTVAPPPPRVPGLDGAPLKDVREGALLAVISRHAEPPELGAVDALWAHERVVERLMAGGAVLPMRFGSRLPDEAALRWALATRHDELLSALDGVRGRVELAVRAVRAGDPPRAAVSPAAVAGAAEGHRGGREYLRTKLELRDRAEAAAAALHTPLCALAVAASRRPGRGPGELLRASYLVERSAVAEFRAVAVRLQGEHPDAAVLCTGPWPPYSFVDVSGGMGG
jgi:hypothetical protein